MTAKSPTREQVARAAEALGLSLDPSDLDEFTEMIRGTVETYYRPLDRLPDNLPPVKYPRTPGYFPTDDEDPLRAWYVKSTIEGRKRGKLRGKTVAIKDNICVAGLPMMNGASVLEGYVPEVDATVVTRTLDAGGTIVGKAHCEYFCYSGSSHTNAAKTTLNPLNPEYTPGGSSSGCAALLAAGEVDLAIGSDQGGSIREPAAFCGLVGMKPTWGLVPYTGAASIEMTLDHLGPMSRTVADNALYLEVLAGADGLDPRQYAPRTGRYTKALDRPSTVCVSASCARVSGLSTARRMSTKPCALRPEPLDGWAQRSRRFQCRPIVNSACRSGCRSPSRAPTSRFSRVWGMATTGKAPIFPACWND